MEMAKTAAQAPQEPAATKPEMEATEPQAEKPEKWTVSVRTCRGCIYYGTFSGGNLHYCDYTYRTGKIRNNPPARCEVKQTGTRRSGFRATSIRRGRKKGGAAK